MMYNIREIDGQIKGAYGLTTVDFDGDGLTDRNGRCSRHRNGRCSRHRNGRCSRHLVVGSIGEPAIVWYEAPSFTKHLITDEHSGNITLVAHDLTGSGRPDLIVGSGFNRRDRSVTEYLHWLERPKHDGEPWVSHFIAEIPFLHRLALLDVSGTGQPVLIVASLRGEEGGYDEWQDPGSLWLYPLPDDPFGSWPRYAIDEQLHLNHGLAICDVDGDGRQDLLVGTRDGLIWFEPPHSFSWTPARGHHLDLCTPWKRWLIYPSESSELFAADVDGDGVVEFLSIEPFHGNELVLYKACFTNKQALLDRQTDLRRGPWSRTVIDDTLNRGHSLEAVDLDGDGKLELVVGYSGEGSSLLIYRQDPSSATGWRREVIDDGLGVGQMQVLDIDGDGELEIVATGLSTGNVRLYKRG